MTEVEKVSIGGYAFTLEAEAYAVVRQYLDELDAFYAQQEGGTEVMEGFEERMAELLYEKCADDGVASVAEIRKIIDILGKPTAIASESGPDAVQACADAGKEKKSEKKDRRKLYRDPTNRQVAGVCSGLAAFFKCDVVLIRSIAIGLFLLTVFPSGNGRTMLVMPITYLVLWLAMPEARTVRQRWEMGVSNPPAGSAVPTSGGRPLGSGLGRVLRVLFGCLLLLFAVAGLTAGLAVLFGPSLFGWELFTETRREIAVHAPGFLPLTTSVLYIVSVLLSGFLPFVGMLYGGIMLLFNLNSPRWRPGLVIFVVWIIALTVFAVLTGLFISGIFLN